MIVLCMIHPALLVSISGVLMATRPPRWLEKMPYEYEEFLDGKIIHQW